MATSAVKLLKEGKDLPAFLQNVCETLDFAVGEIWRKSEAPAPQSSTADEGSSSSFNFVSLYQSPKFYAWVASLLSPSVEAYPYRHQIICPLICQAAVEGGKIVWANTGGEEALISGLDVSVKTVVGVPIRHDGAQPHVAIFLSGSSTAMNEQIVERLTKISTGLLVGTSYTATLSPERPKPKLNNIGYPVSPMHMSYWHGPPHDGLSPLMSKYSATTPKDMRFDPNDMEDILNLPLMSPLGAASMTPKVGGCFTWWPSESGQHGTPVPYAGTTPMPFPQMHAPYSPAPPQHTQLDGKALTETESFDALIYFKISQLPEYDASSLPDRIIDIKGSFKDTFEDFLRGLTYPNCFQIAEFWSQDSNSDFELITGSLLEDQFPKWKPFMTKTRLKLQKCPFAKVFDSMAPTLNSIPQDLEEEDPRTVFVRGTNVQSCIMIPLVFASSRKSCLVLWSTRSMKENMEAFNFMAKCVKALLSENIASLEIPVFRLGNAASISPWSIAEWGLGASSMNHLASFTKQPIPTPTTMGMPLHNPQMHMFRDFMPPVTAPWGSAPLPPPPSTTLAPFSQSFNPDVPFHVGSGFEQPGLNGQPHPPANKQELASGGQLKCRIKACDKLAVKKSTLCSKHTGARQCQRPGCTKCAQGSTPFCIAHGGGRRCTVPGCTKGARDKNFCAAHGGGKRCSQPDCTKAAVGGSTLCTSHGGGKRCTVEGCPKSAQSSTNFCVRHGGGRKCTFGTCNKVARGKTLFCAAHGGGARCIYMGCERAAANKKRLCRAHNNSVGVGGVAAAAAAAAVVPTVVSSSYPPLLQVGPPPKHVPHHPGSGNIPSA
mmetsp:Transcript_17357/g.33022  ORF Transcript_17357/g.33022 Transcript_17357/m.33022 type:complete len:828 (+) Transcript_17357:120-2603(+)